MLKLKMRIRGVILLLGLIIALPAWSEPNSIFAKWPNKWVILNYWAIWCPPCREEIPELNRFYHQHSADAVVIGVNYDSLSGSALNGAIQEAHIDFPVLQTNPASALRLPEINVLPASFIFNPQGKLVAQLIGPQTAAKLEGMIYGRS